MGFRYQPRKLYPDLTGVVGVWTGSVGAMLCAETAEPPWVSNVMVRFVGVIGVVVSSSCAQVISSSSPA